MTAYLTDFPPVFRAAAEHVQTHGHIKGWFCAPGIDIDSVTPINSRPTCIAGAIQLSCTGNPLESNELSQAAIRFASSHMAGDVPVDSETGEPDFTEHLADWNDTHGRTAAEVVARLLRLALDAEQEAREAALLCRWMKAHDDHQPCEWCAEDLAEYQRELQQLRLAVAA
jgi:hypothetical protein